jgi:nucleoid-associated protein YgaU
MIFEGSRYSRSPVLRVTDDDGKVYPAIYGGVFNAPSGFLYHNVVDGDRLDNLAYRYYKDATLWWFIANANPEIFYPEDLKPGQIIRIPQS